MNACRDCGEPIDVDDAVGAVCGCRRINWLEEAMQYAHCCQMADQDRRELALLETQPLCDEMVVAMAYALHEMDRQLIAARLRCERLERDCGYYARLAGAETRI